MRSITAQHFRLMVAMLPAGGVALLLANRLGAFLLLAVIFVAAALVLRGGHPFQPHGTDLPTARGHRDDLPAPR